MSLQGNLFQDLLSGIWSDVVIHKHAIRFRVNDDAQQKDEKEAPPYQPSGSVFDQFTVQPFEDGVSQLKKAFRDTGGVVVVDHLKQIVHRIVIEFLGSNFVGVVPVGKIESGTMLILGSFQEERTVFEDLHQIPFHI
jgi:hypothetical protein